jgi:hypothetical protein
MWLLPESQGVNYISAKPRKFFTAAGGSPFPDLAVVDQDG